MWQQFKSSGRRFLFCLDVPGGTRTGEADGADDALSEDAGDLGVPLGWRHGFGIARGVHAGSGDGARPSVAPYAVRVSGAHPREPLDRRSSPVASMARARPWRSHPFFARDLLITPAVRDRACGETFAASRRVLVGGPVRRLWHDPGGETPGMLANLRQSRGGMRKRRRGLSAAFPENQRAGCFRNRPGNSGGRI